MEIIDKSKNEVLGKHGKWSWPLPSLLSVQTAGRERWTEGEPLSKPVETELSAWEEIVILEATHLDLGCLLIFL